VVVVGSLSLSLSLAKAKGPRKESSRFYYSQALTLQCDGTAQPQRVARRPRRRGDDRPFDDDYPMTNWPIWVTTKLIQRLCRSKTKRATLLLRPRGFHRKKAE
jgi:hypothetical protein